MTGTLINVATVLAGTLIGVTVGSRLPEGFQKRVLAGLGLVTLVVGDRPGAGVAGHQPALRAGRRAAGRPGRRGAGHRTTAGRSWATSSRRASRASDGSRVSEAFFTASLLFCVGPLTVVGSIQDGLTGDYDALATKALLDGFAAIALSATLGWGVALSRRSPCCCYRAGCRSAPALFEDVLTGEPLDALTSAGGVLIIGISLKLLDLKDVKVGNFLPALVFAPALVGIASLF